MLLSHRLPRCAWSPACCGWRSGIERPHPKKVVVFDYGFGNVRSAERALARVGADVEITRDYDTGHERRRAAGPRRRRLRRLHGGAARRPAATGSSAAGWPAAARSWASASACRSSSRRGIEHGVETEGLDEWPGTVGPLKADVVPHMGWNTVEAPGGLAALRRPATPTPASTSCTPTPCTTGSWRSPTRASRAPKVTWATHGEPFVAAVENGALWATQFHPEKSGDAGAQLLTNWIETL